MALKYCTPPDFTPFFQNEVLLMFAKNSFLVQINIHIVKNPGLQTLDLTVYITLTELDSIET